MHCGENRAVRSCRLPRVSSLAHLHLFGRSDEGAILSPDDQSPVGDSPTVASTADFKNGLVLVIDGQLWQIIEFQHAKPGKGPGFVRTKLKNVLSGKVVDKTYNAGVKVETATVDRRDTTYLYRDGTDFVFMDSEDYEQHHLPETLVGDDSRFLLVGLPVQVAFHNGAPLYIERPVTVELVVTHTQAGLQGDRSTAGRT